MDGLRLAPVKRAMTILGIAWVILGLSPLPCSAREDDETESPDREDEAEDEAEAQDSDRNADDEKPDLGDAEAPDETGGPSLAPWFVAGAGGAAVAAGGVFALLSRVSYSDAEDATVHQEAADAEERGDSQAALANLLLLGGGTLITVGVTWALVEAGGASGSEAQVGVGPGSVTLRGRF